MTTMTAAAAATILPLSFLPSFLPLSLSSFFLLALQKHKKSNAAAAAAAKLHADSVTFFD